MTKCLNNKLEITYENGDCTPVLVVEALIHMAKPGAQCLKHTIELFFRQ